MVAYFHEWHFETNITRWKDARRHIFKNNIPMQISPHTREMDGKLISLITLWYLFKTTKRCNVAHVYVKFIYLYYTMKMQRKDIKSLIFNATNWKCSDTMSRKHSQNHPLIFISYKNLMEWQLCNIQSLNYCTVCWFQRLMTL
jgi:hypothetical protein